MEDLHAELQAFTHQQAPELVTLKPALFARSVARKICSSLTGKEIRRNGQALQERLAKHFPPHLSATKKTGEALAANVKRALCQEMIRRLTEAGEAIKIVYSVASAGEMGLSFGEGDVREALGAAS